VQVPALVESQEKEPAPQAVQEPDISPIRDDEIPDAIVEQPKSDADAGMHPDIAKTYPPKAKRTQGMIAAFGSLGISKDTLEEAFGDLTGLSHIDLDHIGEIFAKINAGELTWQDVADTQKDQGR
jgi:hypothetical protein